MSFICSQCYYIATKLQTCSASLSETSEPFPLDGLHMYIAFGSGSCQLFLGTMSPHNDRVTFLLSSSALSLHFPSSNHFLLPHMTNNCHHSQKFPNQNVSRNTVSPFLELNYCYHSCLINTHLGAVAFGHISMVGIFRLLELSAGFFFLLVPVLNWIRSFSLQTYEKREKHGMKTPQTIAQLVKTDSKLQFFKANIMMRRISMKKKRGIDW